MLADENKAQDQARERDNLTPTTPETKAIKKDNPFYPAFDLLLAKLKSHEELIQIAKSRFSITVTDDATTVNDGNFSDLFADISDMRIPDFVKHVPTFRILQGSPDARDEADRNLQTRCYLWIIAEAFECFREFVETIDHCITNLSEPASHRLCIRVYRKIPFTGKRKRNQQGFWYSIKRVRKATPSLRDCEVRNSRDLDLLQWISNLSAVRNAVAHNLGIVDTRRYKKLKSSGFEKEYAGHADPDVGYVLTPTAATAWKVIRTVREYALAIYRAVSDTADVPTPIYDHERGMTVWLH